MELGVVPPSILYKFMHGRENTAEQMFCCLVSSDIPILPFCCLPLKEVPFHIILHKLFELMQV